LNRSVNAGKLTGSIFKPAAAACPPKPTSKPAPLARMAFDPATDFYTLTPEHEAWCRELWDKNQMFTLGPFTPAEVDRTMVTFPSTLGGGNWNGLAYDARSGLAFTNVMNLGQVARMQPTADASDYARTTPWGGTVGRFWNPDTKIPCSAPPFGELVAVNVNTGDIAWKVRLGFVESLKPRGFGSTGALNIGGPIVTASGLLFVGASMDRRFRAFDARTGQLLWETTLDAAAHTVPITYLAGNQRRQFVAVAAGGGSFLGSPPGTKIVAFGLIPPKGDESAPVPKATTTVAPLPDGEGRVAVQRMCSGCQGLTTVMAQRRTPKEWEATVQMMASLGAPGTPSERAAVVGYLASHLGREESAGDSAQH
jgi:quinoprotein glucose dehydrogenase